jgi:transposase
MMRTNHETSKTVIEKWGIPIKHRAQSQNHMIEMPILSAQAAMPSLVTSVAPLGDWLLGLLARTHRNAAVVALANKLARIAWAVLRSGETFDTNAARA